MRQKLWSFAGILGIVIFAGWIMGGPLYGQEAEPRQAGSEQKPRTVGYPETIFADRPILRQGGRDRPLAGVDRSRLVVWIAPQGREGSDFQAILQGLPPIQSIEHLRDLSPVAFLQDLTLITFREPLTEPAVEDIINRLLQLDRVEQVSPVYLRHKERFAANGMIRVQFKEAPWVSETVRREIFNRVQEEFGKSPAPLQKVGKTVFWIAPRGAPVFTIAQLLSREIAVVEATPVLVPLKPNAQADAWVIAHGLPRSIEALTIGDPFIVIVEVRTKAGYQAALNPNTLVSEFRKSFHDLPDFSMRVEIQDPRKEPWSWFEKHMHQCSVVDPAVPTCTFKHKDKGKMIKIQQARFHIQLFFVGRPWTVGPLVIPVSLPDGGTVPVVTPEIKVTVNPTLPAEMQEPIGTRPLPKPRVVRRPAPVQQAKKPEVELRPWQRKVTAWVRERTKTWFGLERYLTERPGRLYLTAGIAGAIGFGFLLAALGMIGIPVGRWLSRRLFRWGVQWAAYAHLWTVRWVPFPEFPQKFQERLLRYLAIVQGEQLQPNADALARALGLPEPYTWLEKRVEKEALLQFLRGERRGNAPQSPRSDLVVLFILANLARYAGATFNADEARVLRAALARSLKSLVRRISRIHGGAGVPVKGRI